VKWLVAILISLTTTAVKCSTAFLLSIEQVPFCEAIIQHKIWSFSIVHTLTVFNDRVPHCKKNCSRIGKVCGYNGGTGENFRQTIVLCSVAKPKFTAIPPVFVKIKTFIHVILDHPIGIIFTFDASVGSEVWVVCLVENGRQCL